MISTITLDTYKQQIGSGDAFNLSDSFNGRVGDEQVPLEVHFKERGQAHQFADNLVPFLSGFVGDLDENNQVTAANGTAVSYQGSRDDVVGLGRVKLNLPGSIFPQEGYFYGFLGLETPDHSHRESTFTVWFHVYNGNPDMFVNKAPFRSELQKLLDTAQQAVTAANSKYKNQFQAEFDKIASLSSDAANHLTEMISQLDILQAKIKSSDIATNTQLTQALSELNNNLMLQIGKRPTNTDVVDMIKRGFTNFDGGQPHAIASSDVLKKTYPDGHDGVFVAVDTGHKWMWGPDGSWIDGGLYQSPIIEDHSIKSAQLTNLARPSMILGEKNVEFDVNLATRKLTWGMCQVTSGTGLEFFNPGSADITVDLSDGGYIMADLENKVFWTYAPNTPELWDKAEASSFVGVIYADGEIWVNTNKFYSAGNNDQFSNRSLVAAHSRSGWIQGPSNSTVDLTKNAAGKLELTFSTSYLILFGQKVRFITTDELKSWDLSSLLGVGGYIVMDNRDLSFKGVPRDNETDIDDHAVIMGMAWGDGSFTMFSNMTTTMNGYTSWAHNEVPSRFATLIMSQHSYFDVDTTKNPWQLVPPDYFQVVFGDFYGQVFKNVSKVELPKNDDGSVWGGLLVINRDSGVIRGIGMGTRITARESPIGYVYVDGTVWINGSQTSSTLEKSILNLEIPNEGRMKMLNLGDSITYGWDGKEAVSVNWSKFVASKLDAQADNAGIGGATIMEQGDVTKTFDAELDYDRDYTAYDLVTVMFGVNDYMNSKHTLDEIKAKLTDQLTTLQKKVTHGKLYGILPLPSYRTPLPDFWTEQSAQTTKNNYNYTMDEMMDVLKSIYQEFKMPVLDWREHQFITDSNYKYWLPNDGLHPSQKGYIRMGQIITNFIINN